jgi:hypothetical protein
MAAVSIRSWGALLLAAAAGAAGATTALPAQPPAKAVAAKARPVVAAQPAKAAPAVAPKALEPLGEAELAIAANVYVGALPCELGQTVELQADATAPGHFHLRLKQAHYHLRPVVSSTGAVRLEDAGQGVVWLQLANKSMLMSQKLGRRLADECASPVQQAMAEQLKRHPAPHLLDVAQSPRLD